MREACCMNAVLPRIIFILIHEIHYPVSSSSSILDCHLLFPSWVSHSSVCLFTTVYSHCHTLPPTVLLVAQQTHKLPSSPTKKPLLTFEEEVSVLPVLFLISVGNKSKIISLSLKEQRVALSSRFLGNILWKCLRRRCLCDEACKRSRQANGNEWRTFRKTGEWLRRRFQTRQPKNQEETDGLRFYIKSRRRRIRRPCIWNESSLELSLWLSILLISAACLSILSPSVHHTLSD